MEVQQDFKELLELLNEHQVDYLIVGGYALAFHGAPRYTGDIDILVKPEPENALKTMKAIEAFGFGAIGIEAKDFENPSNVVQLGVPPVRIDIITSITGVSIDKVFSGSTPGKYGDINVKYIGREELLQNKRAAGRKKDLSDLEALGEE